MADVVSTGIAALDKALMGGLPKGFTVLVGGAPGSGTELFAKQFAAAAGRDENVVYLTTTERDEDVEATMDLHGWKTDMKIVNVGRQYYETVLARELEISRHRLEGLAVKELRGLKVESRKPVNFLTALTYEVSKLKPPFRLVIDSLDFFLESYSPADVVSALRTIKAHVQHHGGVSLATMLTGVHDTKIQSGVEEIVDAIIELERQREGSEFRHNLVIRKVRNRPEKVSIWPYTFAKGGITIVEPAKS